MILKQTRMPVGDGEAFRNYLRNPGENEEVKVLVGDPENVVESEMISSLLGRVYGSRHVIVSPDRQLSRSELASVIMEFVKEFRVPAGSKNRIVVVEHRKQRSDASQGAGRHYHLAIPEIDHVSGEPLDAAFTAIRNEKIARLSELVLGHEIIPGRYNKEVYGALQDAGIDVGRFRSALIAARLDEGCSQDEAEATFLDFRAYGGFSSSQHKTAERLGVSLPRLMKRLRDAIEERFSDGTSKIDDRIAVELGIRLTGILQDEGLETFVQPESGNILIRKNQMPICGLAKLLGLDIRNYPILKSYLLGEQNAIRENVDKPSPGEPRRAFGRDRAQARPDFDSAARGRDGWRKWRESVRDFGRRDREAGDGLNQAPQGVGRDYQHPDSGLAAVGRLDEHSNLALSFPLPPPPAPLQINPEVAPGIEQSTINTEDFDMDGVRRLMTHASAVLARRARQEASPDRYTPLVELKGYEPSDLINPGGLA